MRMGTFGATAASVICLFVSSASADTIDFAQFGPDGTVLANAVNGTTLGGVGFTLTGVGFGFTRVTANTSDWVESQFPVGVPLVWDASSGGDGPGAVTIDFWTPISSIASLAAESNNFGPYTATLTAYDGPTLLGTSSYSATGLMTSLPGTLPSFYFSAPAITSITIDTSTDSTGFAIGSVPEPSTWAMMALGFMGLGLVGYRSSRRVA